MKILMLALCLTVTGCATCREHPIACTAATAFVAGSIALAAADHHRDRNDLNRRVDAGLHTRCAPIPHGAVLLPPNFNPWGCQ